MADWESLSTSPRQHSDTNDVMSMFTTKSASPLYTMNGNVSELQFASPAKDSAWDNDVSHGAAYCREDNIDQCIANINQVTFRACFSYALSVRFFHCSIGCRCGCLTVFLIWCCNITIYSLGRDFLCTRTSA